MDPMQIVILKLI